MFIVWKAIMDINFGSIDLSYAKMRPMYLENVEYSSV